MLFGRLARKPPDSITALAVDAMVGPLADADSVLARQVAFGAAALARVEARLARHILDERRRDESSLLKTWPVLASV